MARATLKLDLCFDIHFVNGCIEEKKRHARPFDYNLNVFVQHVATVSVECSIHVWAIRCFEIKLRSHPLSDFSDFVLPFSRTGCVSFPAIRMLKTSTTTFLCIPHKFWNNSGVSAVDCVCVCCYMAKRKSVNLPFIHLFHLFRMRSSLVLPFMYRATKFCICGVHFKYENESKQKPKFVNFNLEIMTK